MVPLVDNVVLFGGEALSALVAKILLFLAVLLLMRCQGLARGEADATLRAAKRSLHRMHPLVDVEVLLAAKSLSTLLAPKRLYSQVGLLVSKKPLATWEPFPAIAAEKLFFVAPFVVAEGGGAAKGLAALGAGVGLFIGVRPLVGNQVRLLGERLAAVGALEGFLARVKLLVLNKLGLATEALATLRADHQELLLVDLPVNEEPGAGGEAFFAFRADMQRGFAGRLPAVLSIRTASARSYGEVDGEVLGFGANLRGLFLGARAGWGFWIYDNSPLLENGTRG